MRLGACLEPAQDGDCVSAGSETCQARAPGALLRCVRARVGWPGTALVICLIGLALASVGRTADLPALTAEPEFLPADQAFRFGAWLDADEALVAQWTMPDGYYLYRHRFEFELPAGAGLALAPVELPEGKRKRDEFFGEVEVYYQSVQARAKIIGQGVPSEAIISFQGCAEAGLCYPPERRRVGFSGAGSLGETLPASSAASPEPPPATASAAEPEPMTTQQRLAALLADSSLPLTLLLFFLAGVGLTFTPCVLPMVPILSSIIVGEGSQVTRVRALTLSLSYVSGMAVTYAILGTLMGLFGARLNLQAALQAPLVLTLLAALFVALALSMFGFYELRLPQRWQQTVDRQGQRLGGGKHWSVAGMGVLSTLVVSPCVSAPLAGALVHIGATGDVLYGGSALLALGLGMGAPLLIVGASGGHLLPRAGAWMDAVKAVFGVLLLATAIWLLERVLPAPATLALWALLLIGSGCYLGALDRAPQSGWGRLWQATGLVGLLCGSLLLVGAASGARDPLRPLAALGVSASSTSSSAEAATLAWRPVADLPELQTELTLAAAADKLAILDLYADWCISCKIMEHSVFPQPEVAAALAEFHLLRADVTRNTAEDKALLDAYGLFGPPSLLFFDRTGQELVEARLQGEVDAPELSAHLRRLRSRPRS